MKRTIITIISALTIIAGLAAPASARVGPGPQFIKALNANVCVSASPDQPNTSVIQGDYAEGHCRKMFFVLEGHINGFQYGEWETRGLNAMASANCSSVNLAPPHATGTVWVIFVMGGGQTQIVNRRCDGMHGHNDCREVLAATGNIGQIWNVVDKRLQPGFFVNMHIIQQRNSGRVRAGC